MVPHSQKSLVPWLLAAVAVSPSALVAQQAPEEDTRPVVSEVECHVEGGRKIDPAAIEAHVRLKVGDRYSSGVADNSVRSLYATGLYRYVQVEPELAADGKTAKLHVRVTPYRRVTGVRFVGNSEWDVRSMFLSDLSEELEFKVGDVLSDVLIKRSKEKLIKKYDKYYPFTTVDARVEPDTEGGGVVVFTVDEGLATKVQRIEFEGNKSISAKELRDQLETSTWSWTFDTAYYPGGRFLKFSWLTGWGRFHTEEFRQDLEKLREFYRNQGFLDVEIPDKAVDTNYVAQWPEDKQGRLAVRVRVTEGRRYAVGDVKIEGNRLGDKFARFRTDSILTMLASKRRDRYRPYPYGDRVIDFFFGKSAESDDMRNRRTEFDYLKSGDWYAPKAEEGAVEKLRDYYGETGYLDAQIRVERHPNLLTGKIDLVFKIREGEKFYLRSVNVSGNTKTRTSVIVRELALAPGEVFDTVRMRNSEARLRNTRFFEESRLSPESTNLPNQRNLRISIKEGRTGSLTFGAGFSTVESLVGFAEYSESNFDLFNSRNYFRGGGQKFRFRVSAGTRTSSVEQSFEEPWVYERELAFGYRAYYTSSNFASSAYDEVRGGIEPYFRSRVYELIEARTAYNIEDVEIKDIDSSAPAFIQKERGHTTISKGSLTLSRDTRDSYIFPTYGNRVSLSNEVAGGPFGGQVDYYRIEARATQWLPMFDAGEQTLMLLGRTGAMVPFNDNYIPFYERFRLGGAYNMRGFKYGFVGPFDRDEPTGGNTYGLFTAEYTVKIIEQLRFAVFYDWGFVNSSGFDYNTSGYNDDWGVGFRVLVMGAVMRIDVGFPITTSPNNDDGVRFNFSFGTQF